MAFNAKCWRCDYSGRMQLVSGDLDGYGPLRDIFFQCPDCGLIFMPENVARPDVDWDSVCYLCRSPGPHYLEDGEVICGKCFSGLKVFENVEKMPEIKTERRPFLIKVKTLKP
ncbi:hypothetical protein F1737_10445 [Methanoplanus sp. FWC-SCC4]|uniref:Uncharacterized protein n=1 Tax=Methanochimaera problematica TaxID=2609417 RepID=A0AA97FDQ1_9EURY|nr:hypothetical protein [Methanoplanus sp. FWC-SCC4]WOF17064.1 hypothetical protein F1737_10445 [Methanoplanus sp. FWC-SCC4]